MLNPTSRKQKEKMRNACEVMSKRVFNIMFHDVNNRLMDWSSTDGKLWKFDYERIKIFKDWLVAYGESYGYCNKEYK